MPEPFAEPLRDLDLEDRLRRLETAVAERSPDDDALADRVIARLSARAAERERNPDSAPVLVLAATGDAAPPPPPQGAVLHPPSPPAPADTAPRRWFLPNLIAELRLIATMYFDPRYRISRTTQFALPGILLLLIFNYCFFSVWVSITFLSPFVERLLAVIAGMLIYTLLIREVARYREVLAYLARYGR
jgi:hypothetical protein